MIHPLVLQIGRFGVVGLCAAALHYMVVINLVQNDLLTPLAANVIGFLCGFQVSYWGHRKWTFRATAAHRIAVPRMLVVQGLNLVANESLFYVLLSAGLPYPVALLIVLIVLPIFTFIASKIWVFD